MCTQKTMIALLLIAAGAGRSFTANAFITAGTTPTAITDTTQVGSRTVPQIGCGTIAWSDNGDNSELKELISTTYQQGGAFIDTGERYGSHAKTALGMGWGETESLVAKLLREHNGDSTEGSANEQHVVATKFTPSPWRTTAESVVEACEESRKRLGVESIDLYQIQMPDIVKVRMIHLLFCLNIHM